MPIYIPTYVRNHIIAESFKLINVDKHMTVFANFREPPNCVWTQRRFPEVFAPDFQVFEYCADS